MDGQDESETKSGKAHYRSLTCQMCGEPIGSDFIKCPEDGRICHNDGQCSRAYENKELGIRQMLCVISYKARLKEEERKATERHMQTAKILLGILAAIVIYFLVKGWL